MKEGVGRNSLPGTQFPRSTRLLRLHPPPLFPLPELPGLPSRHLAPYVFLSRNKSSHIRSGEEV